MDADPESSKLPARLGSYVVDRELVAGRFDVRARVHRDGSDEALLLRVLRPSLASDPRFLRILEREVGRCAGLEHPNLTSVLALEYEAEHRFVVARYVDGLALSALLARRGSGLKPRQVLDVALQICDGLEVMHTGEGGSRRPLAHHDLRPGTVVVQEDGQVVLSDSSVARARFRWAARRGDPAAGAATRYLSPEQAAGKKAGLRSDFFRLGTLVWELLMGTPLFVEPTRPRTLERVISADTKTALKDVDAALPGSGDFLARLLARSPGQRPEAVDEIRRGLAALERSHRARAGRKRRRKTRGGPRARDLLSSLTSLPGVRSPALQTGPPGLTNRAGAKPSSTPSPRRPGARGGATGSIAPASAAVSPPAPGPARRRPGESQETAPLAAEIAEDLDTSSSRGFLEEDELWAGGSGLAPSSELARMMSELPEDSAGDGDLWSVGTSGSWTGDGPGPITDELLFDSVDGPGPDALFGDSSEVGALSGFGSVESGSQPGGLSLTGEFESSLSGYDAPHEDGMQPEATGNRAAAQPGDCAADEPGAAADDEPGAAADDEPGAAAADGPGAGATDGTIHAPAGPAGQEPAVGQQPALGQPLAAAQQRPSAQAQPPDRPLRAGSEAPADAPSGDGHEDPDQALAQALEDADRVGRRASVLGPTGSDADDTSHDAALAAVLGISRPLPELIDTDATLGANSGPVPLRSAADLASDRSPHDAPGAPNEAARRLMGPAELLAQGETWRFLVRRLRKEAERLGVAAEDESGFAAPAVRAAATAVRAGAGASALACDLLLATLQQSTPAGAAGEIRRVRDTLGLLREASAALAVARMTQGGGELSLSSVRAEARLLADRIDQRVSGVAIALAALQQALTNEPNPPPLAATALHRLDVIAERAERTRRLGAGQLARAVQSQDAQTGLATLVSLGTLAAAADSWLDSAQELQRRAIDAVTRSRPTDELEEALHEAADLLSEPETSADLENLDDLLPSGAAIEPANTP